MSDCNGYFSITQQRAIGQGRSSNFLISGVVFNIRTHIISL